MATYLDLLPEPIHEYIYRLAARSRIKTVLIDLRQRMVFWRSALNREANQRRRAHEAPSWSMHVVHYQLQGMDIIHDPYTDRLFPFRHSMMKVGAEAGRRARKRQRKQKFVQESARWPWL